jgi:hypothetical protein
MEQKNQATSVNNYRQSRKKEDMLTLPSGAVFKIKRLTVLDFLKEGLEELPNEFFKFIDDMVKGGDIEQNEDYKKSMELCDNMIKIAVEKGILEPQVMIKYDKEKVETHLLFSELTMDDQAFLIRNVIGTHGAVF